MRIELGELAGISIVNTSGRSVFEKGNTSSMIWHPDGSISSVLYFIRARFSTVREKIVLCKIRYIGDILKAMHHDLLRDS